MDLFDKVIYAVLFGICACIGYELYSIIVGIQRLFGH
jgi:hypothetical protein